MATFRRNLLATVALLAAVSGCNRGEPATAGAADVSEPAGIADTLGNAAAAVTEAVTPLSPRQRVERALAAMADLESFHVSMATTGPSLQASATMNMQMDFIAPDRYRITTPMGTHTVIGNTSYMAMGSGKPVVMQLGEDFDPDMTDVGMDETTVVEALGSERIDGERASRYRVRDAGPDATPTTLWIDADGRVLQMQAEGPGGADMTARYSRFNDDSIRIEPPQ